MCHRADSYNLWHQSCLRFLQTCFCSIIYRGELLHVPSRITRIACALGSVWQPVCLCSHIFIFITIIFFLYKCWNFAGLLQSGLKCICSNKYYHGRIKTLMAWTKIKRNATTQVDGQLGINPALERNDSGHRTYWVFGPLYRVSCPRTNIYC